MKVVLAVALLLSPTLCRAQDGGATKRVADGAYTARLVRLVEGLQKNPWRGWKAGTVVVVRYLGDAVNGMDARVQPDLVYKILEADKLFERTQEYKGKFYRQEFLVKDEPGLTAANKWAKDAAAADLEIDGFTLSGLLTKFSVEEFPGGTRTTEEWSLASHPSILLRQETNGEGWRITSARASKKVGEREFECVEIKKRMRFYSGGPMVHVTTQYLSPEVPGHVVEEVEEFYRVSDKGVLTLNMVVHQKVVELKIQ
ncbi:MAG TPA: hypothetical protein VGP08_22430 [Pyrinomonadaceae bacterium]|jgi:hypothetical protein|nr:hypothetical protein [Pyrinomonadaceae bacterium]